MASGWYSSWEYPETSLELLLDNLVIGVQQLQVWVSDLPPISCMTVDMLFHFCEPQPHYLQNRKKKRCSYTELQSKWDEACKQLGTVPGTRFMLSNVHAIVKDYCFPITILADSKALCLLYCRYWWMCLKNSYLLEWFCLHQPGRGLWLPLSFWALLLWWLPPWRRTEAQWTGVDLERRQVFCLFLQGEANRVQQEL